MSVINQVLNRLEQRGVPMATGQTMVHAVLPPKRKSHLSLLALVLMLELVAWQAFQQWQERNSIDLAAQRKPVPAGAALTVENTPVGPLSPASRLSFELGSVPLPSTIHSSGKEQGRPFDPSTSPGQALRQGSMQALRQGSGQARNTKAQTPADTAASVPPTDQHLTVQKTPANSQAASGVLPLKHISPAQQADAEFRKAVALMQQGRVADAIAGYEAALRLDAGHDTARQTLVALLLEEKRAMDAERVLQERLQSNPDHAGFAMLRARLQVERDALEQAAATLEKSLPYADAQADYQAFFAALLQRQNRHKEAVAHYQAALQLAPGKGVWLMGYGISLQAMQRNDEAREAFNRALDSKTLSPELQAFVQQRLKGL